MKNGLADHLAASIVEGKRTRRDPLNQRPILCVEVAVERALEGSRRCRQCATVHGRYVCIPSAAVRSEWRHSDSGLELIVHLLTCQPAGASRLQAMILVKKESRFHARAVYTYEPLTMELEDGPWTLKLISEKSDCDFVFPGEVEIASSGTLLTPYRAGQTSTFEEVL